MRSVLFDGPAKAFRLNFESPKPCQAYGFPGLLATRWLKLKAESYNGQSEPGTEENLRPGADYPIAAPLSLPSGSRLKT